MLNKLSKPIERQLENLLKNTGDMALKRRARRIIEEINPQNGDKILDVGCGDGYYLYLLSNLRLKLELTGVDYEDTALVSARRNLKGKKIKLVHADLMKSLPFKPEAFDKAVMSEVVEHLPNDTKGLKEVKRILIKRGRLVLTVPNHNYPFLWDPVNWILEHLLSKHVSRGFWSGIWNQHLRLYYPEEIRRVIKKAGLEVVRSESLTWWCLPFNHHIVNIGARLLASRASRARQLISGANKFRDEQKGLIPRTYFFISTLIDRMNDMYPLSGKGVSVFIRATK